MEHGQMRLESLLQDDRDRALSLLKKAFNPENRLPLQDLQKALELDFVSKYLEDLTTEDVIPESDSGEDYGSNGRQSSGERKSRTRFSDADKGIMKDMVLSLIQNAEGSGTTINAIVSEIQKEYPAAQQILIAGFLKDWEKDHKIFGNNSRPKLWMPLKEAAAQPAVHEEEEENEDDGQEVTMAKVGRKRR